ncbi:MAG: aconitate hydratase AcnA, partial [Candidatus Omnitrophota bacterium]
MAASNKDTFKLLKTGGKTVGIYHLAKLTKLGLPKPENLPYSIKVLLENALRNWDDYQVQFEDIKKLASWQGRRLPQAEIAFKPGRVILQDFTGVPCVVDLAAMRSAMKRLGGDYRKINPQVPCDLVVDHSLQTDAYGSPKAILTNVRQEFKRNRERYEFLKWGQRVFRNFRVVPPSTGIVHQVNLEYLAQGVLIKKAGKEKIAYPDSVVGTDSHTTMINGIGIVGWGVGGIEAEAVMLGEPIYMLLPEVVGFKLTGELPDAVTATDLVLTITQILRKKGVVGKFVEFFGPSLKTLSLPDRATIANMAPEYGATMGIFPVDDETLDYYRLTGRKSAQVDLIERYTKEQGMFYLPSAPAADYTDILDLDLSTIEPSLAGPKRPQDRVLLKNMQASFRNALRAPLKERGFELSEDAATPKDIITHGAVVIASITSCTNTSNPAALISAGLLAKKAVERGLTVPAYVKTSLAPGSQVAEEYLSASGLLAYLEQLKFHIVGYGCATCIGNSGPLAPEIAGCIQRHNLVAAAVLSGNRNFEGRINPHTKANYLASPPLVVAYGLAGTVDIDFMSQPVGLDTEGKPVFLSDLWPSRDEVRVVMDRYVTAKAYAKRYKNVFGGNAEWEKIKAPESELFRWKAKSTYIQEPPFFTGMTRETRTIHPVIGARVLVKVGDSITTDHISPAGAIAVDSPAGSYLRSLGVAPEQFNSYGSRRGNDRVMVRGTFANIRLRNQLAPGTEGAWTIHFPSRAKMTIYDAAQKYQQDKTPLLVLAGKEYGTGSSRDWAAKGTALLGVKIVLA